MNHAITPEFFIDTLFPVVEKCAKASLIFYGDIANIGKTPDTTLTGHIAQEASTIFTALDSGIQDILISSLKNLLPDIGIIAEENTALKKRYNSSKSPYTVIIDPIDGTWHFKQGDAPYHICIGLAYKGSMLASIIARPTENKIFTAVRDQGAFVHLPNRPKTRLSICEKNLTKEVFISSKAKIYQQLARQGYDLIPREKPIGAALVLTQIAEGKLCGYLTREVAIYDAGPPSLIAEEAGARCFTGLNDQPRYIKRRKFAHFIAAANEDIAKTLLKIVNSGRKLKRNL